MFTFEEMNVSCLVRKQNIIFFLNLHEVMTYDYFILLTNKLHHLIITWTEFALWVEGDKSNSYDTHIL